jgi:hypothetical protein
VIEGHWENENDLRNWCFSRQLKMISIMYGWPKIIHIIHASPYVVNINHLFSPRVIENYTDCPIMDPRINGSTWIVKIEGRRFNSLHPRSSYSYLSSGSLISLKPPAAPPSSFFYLRLVAFCYFLSSLTRFCPPLIRFPMALFGVVWA